MNDAQTTATATPFGSWQEAANLRKRWFFRRTPQQRLAWLIAALEIAYQCGALRPRRSTDGEGA